MKVRSPLTLLNISIFCRAQFLLPVLFLFFQENGLNAGDFFLFEGISAFIGLFLLIPSGYISDFCHKKYILLISFLCLLIKTILWIFVSVYTSILIGTFLNAFSKSLYFTTSDSYIYEYLSLNKKEQEMSKRYGKLNFYFSFGIAISSIFSSIFYSKFGAIFLLILDFILTSFAIFLISSLPNLPIVHKASQKKLKYRFFEMFLTIKRTLKNNNINSFIFLCAIFCTSTLITANSFQPIMKIVKIPIYIFGTVYFVNYLFRSIGGLFANSFEKKFSLLQLSCITYAFFVVSLFLLSISSINLNKSLTIIAIFISCIAIALEVMFNTVSVSYIHKQIFFKRRSAVSSVIFSTSKLFSAIFLSSFKFLLKYFSIQTTIVLYISVFSLLFFIIQKNILKNK